VLIGRLGGGHRACVCVDAFERQLSFALDAMDCLTLCNWAMLYCLRARTCHARAQALREDIRRYREAG